MPASYQDSESAALYKQLLTRPLHVPITEEPEDVRLVHAFSPLCCSTASGAFDASVEGAKAFTQAWVQFNSDQAPLALQGRRRFLARFEYPSIWETKETQGHLEYMYSLEDSLNDGDTEMPPDASEILDHDADKPRATIEQYVALMGNEVACNLEGLARARIEKHAKRRDTDAQIHEAYMRVTTGGGAGDGCAVDADGDENQGASADMCVRQFPPVPWGFLSAEELHTLLQFEKRARVSAYGKELLALPCMHRDSDTDIRLAEEHRLDMRNAAARTNACYDTLCNSPLD